MMTKSMRCVLDDIRNLPHYDGLTGMELYLYEFEREVLKEN